MGRRGEGRDGGKILTPKNGRIKRNWTRRTMMKGKGWTSEGSHAIK